jgi:hypothetical protein
MGYIITRPIVSVVALASLGAFLIAIPLGVLLLPGTGATKIGALVGVAIYCLTLRSLHKTFHRDVASSLQRQIRIELGRSDASRQINSSEAIQASPETLDEVDQLVRDAWQGW